MFDRFKDGSFWLVFLLIYCSQDALLFGTNANKIFFLIKNIFLVLVLCLLVRKSNKNISVNKNSSKLALFGLVVMSLLTSVLNFDITLKYFYEILLFFYSL